MEPLSDHGPERQVPPVAAQTTPQLPPPPDILHFAGLKKLLSPAYSAAVVICSDDKDFLKETIPAILSGIPEASRIWELILSPSTNEGQILARRHVVMELRACDAREELQELKNRAYGITRGVDALFQHLELPDGRRATLLEAYRSQADNGGARFGFDNSLLREAERAFRAIVDGKKALQTAAGILSRHKDPMLKRLGQDLQTVYQKVAEFSPEFFLRRDLDEFSAKNRAKNAEKVLCDFGALLEMGALGERDGLCAGDFEADREPFYREGFSLVLPESRKHPNPSPAYSAVTVYSGSNMSGKSESGLKQNFFGQLLLQSFGLFPGAEANAQVHDFFFYLDRPSTDHLNSLSAFGKEISGYKSTIPFPGKRPFGCIDEGGSTTSPDGQRILLTALRMYMTECSARLFVSSHNEEFLEAAARDPACKVYHFETDVLPDGKVAYHYRLKEGIADSNSIAVAKGLGFDPIMIERAERYLAGQCELPEQSQRPFFTLPVAMSEEERQALKKNKGTWQALFPVPKKEEDRLLQLFSQDPQFLQNGDYWHGNIPLCDGLTEDTRPRFFLGGGEFVGGGSPDLATALIENGPPLEGSELLERQRTFQTLRDSDRYEEFCRLHLEMQKIMLVLPRTYHLGVELLSFNRRLNPLNDRDYREPSKFEMNLAISEVYLSMHEKLLGDSAEVADMLKEVRQLARLLKASREVCFAQELGELGEAVRAARQEPIDDRLREVVAQEFYREGGVGEDFYLLRTCGELECYLTSRGKRIYGFWFSSEANREARMALDRLVPLPERKLCLELLTPLEQEHGLTAGSGDEISYARVHAAYEYLRYGERRTREKLTHIDSELDRACRALPIPDESLCREVSETLSGAVLESSRRPTLWNLEAHISKRLECLSKAFSGLPRINAYECPLEDVRDEIKGLADFFEKRAHDYNFLLHGDPWPNQLEVAMSLELALSTRNPFKEFGDLLRGYDSVHLHRLANQLEKDFSEWTQIFEAYRWWDTRPEDFTTPESAAKLLDTFGKKISRICSPEELARARQELLAGRMEAFTEMWSRLSVNDPRQVFTMMRHVYLDKLQELYGEFVQIEEQRDELRGRFNWAGDSHSTRKIMALLDPWPANREKAFDRVESYVREVLHNKWPDDIPPARTEERDAWLREYFERVIRPSPLYKEAGEYREANDILEAQARALAWKYRLSLEEDYRDDAVYQVKRAVASYCDDLFYEIIPQDYEDQAKRQLYKDISGAVSLALLARHFNLRRYAGLEVNEEGVVHIEDLENMLDSGDQVRQAVHFDSNSRVQLLNGPNMSGKTHREKGLVVGLCCVLSTGHGPGRRFCAPQFRHLPYLDRVTTKEERTLSSMGNELSFWGRLIPLLREGVPVFSAIDEGFSTMSPRYQEAFTFSYIAEAYRLGQFVTFSGHNHRVFDVLDKLAPEITLWYLDYCFNEEGDIEFKYSLRPGHAPSETLAVARKLGLHPDVLRIAEQIA